jgi:hypothetical protein
VEAAPVVAAPIAETAEPPLKKSKKNKTNTGEVPAATPAIEAPVVEASEPIEKKHRKKNKSKDPADEIPPVAVTVDSVETEKKKKKKDKKAKLEEEPLEPTPVAEQWNPDALTGDAARKEKFLRLLGAKKPGDLTTSSKSKSKSSKVAEVEKMQTDLEQQYKTGMKHKQAGRKRGLGA